MFDSASVKALTTALAQPCGEMDDAGRIDAIRALEELKCAAEAMQAELAVDFDDSQREAERRAGVPAERRGRGVAAQIALARRESHDRGKRHLVLGRILRNELPCTRAAFMSGRVTEWKATLVARETACLSLADRRAIDVRLAGDPATIEAMGDGELVSTVRAWAHELDAASFVDRRRRAEADRRVSARPAPDVMMHLSALLPVKLGVAAFAALVKEADRLIASGDPRGRGQIMADTLVQRILNPAETQTSATAVMINLVVSDRVLLGGAAGSAFVDGYGPIPGDLAREMVAEARDRAWLRRLYEAPASGDLVAMDSRARRFPAGLARLIRLRDRRCRTPYCDAPIRHSDHVQSVDERGATSGPNGQGLCEACNHAKQALGWSARPRPGPTHTVVTTTPTGHSYTSTAPRLVDTMSTPAEYSFSRLVLAC
jgi:hypothetical protein